MSLATGMGWDPPDGMERLVAFVAAIEVAAITAAAVGYFKGQSLDRKRAIERIREKRRSERELSLGWHEMPNDPHIQLVAIAF